MKKEKINPGIKKEAKDRIGEILSRLVPGGDFIIHAYDDEIEWREAGDIPSKKEIEDALDAIKAEEAQKAVEQSNKLGKKAALRAMAGRDLTPEEIKTAVQGLLEVL